MNKSVALLGAVAFLSALGCRGTAMPSLFHPGPEKYQQARAEYYDPYPSTEMGPKMVGARPLDYEIPRPETEQVQTPPPSWTTAQWCPWNWFKQ